MVFGPKPRDFSFKLNKNMRRAAIRSVLAAKVWEGRVLVVDGLPDSQGKTKNLWEWAQEATGIPRTQISTQLTKNVSMLIMDSTSEKESDAGVKLRYAGRNLQGVQIVPAEGINVRSILLWKHLIITRTALEEVVQKLTTKIRRYGLPPRGREVVREYTAPFAPVVEQKNTSSSPSSPPSSSPPPPPPSSSSSSSSTL